MLIIAIPRSASTSLMVTFSGMHTIPYRQLCLGHWSNAKEYKYLHSIHNDFKEIDDHYVKYIQHLHHKEVFKNHIPPTEDNLKLLKDIKKVILLRKPYDIVMSYKRAYDKKMDNMDVWKDFKDLKTEKDWISRSIELGMFEDLHKFLSIWLIIGREDNNLIISYDDIVNNTVETLKKVSRHFGLHDKHNNIILEKQRYTRD